MFRQTFAADLLARDIPIEDVAAPIGHRSIVVSKIARTALKTEADATLVRLTVTERFIKAGGRSSAADFIVSKARDLFTVECGALVGKAFDPDKLGQKLTVDGWLTQ